MGQYSVCQNVCFNGLRNIISVLACILRKNRMGPTSIIRDDLNHLYECFILRQKLEFVWKNVENFVVNVPWIMFTPTL